MLANNTKKLYSELIRLKHVIMVHLKVSKEAKRPWLRGSKFLARFAGNFNSKNNHWTDIEQPLKKHKIFVSKSSVISLQKHKVKNLKENPTF